MIRCAQCSAVIRAGDDDRMPPWCPKCGVDLKTALGQAPPAGVPAAAVAPAGPAAAASTAANGTRVPTAVASPSSLTPPAPAREETLQHLIARVTQSQHDEQHTVRRNRGTGLQALCLGILLFGAGLGLAWLSLEWSGGRYVVVSYGLILLGLTLSVAGLYSFVTGRNTLLRDDRDQPPPQSF